MNRRGFLGALAAMLACPWPTIATGAPVSALPMYVMKPLPPPDELDNVGESAAEWERMEGVIKYGPGRYSLPYPGQGRLRIMFERRGNGTIQFWAKR